MSKLMVYSFAFSFCFFLSARKKNINFAYYNDNLRNHMHI